MRPYRLMIDAGHGGSDPGAISRDLKIKEKDITLAIALQMVSIITFGDFLYTVRLTRTEDKYISLRDRTLKEQFWQSEAFLSIHCNARPLRGKPGLEIEVYHFDGSKKGREFAEITLEILLDTMRHSIDVIDRGVKVGNYYVLRNTKSPAIIAELGFLTDDEEAVFLNNNKNQKEFARALAEAAEFFFEGGP